MEYFIYIIYNHKLTKEKLLPIYKYDGSIRSLEERNLNSIHIHNFYFSLDNFVRNDSINIDKLFETKNPITYFLKQNDGVLKKTRFFI